MVDENIFSALEKYTGENYLTESFVFLINSLLEKEPAVALEILTKLCVENNEFAFDTDEVISVSTQEIIDQGILDIKISSPNKQIYIEVKDYSPVKAEQLRRYKEDLESSNATFKQLILLTRFPVDSSEHLGIPDRHVRWSDVYNWLADVKDKTQDPVSVYLIKSFMSFLEVKGMTIQKVEWEYIKGVPAFNNLINMLEEAIKGAKIPIHGKSSGWDYKGFWLKDKEYFCGVYTIDNPLVIIFELIDKTKYNKELLEDRAYEVREDAKEIWFRLSLEKIHFFSLDKDEQLGEITKFVKTVYAEAQKMRIKEK